VLLQTALPLPLLRQCQRRRLLQLECWSLKVTPIDQVIHLWGD
jgi:hypothetical protein